MSSDGRKLVVIWYTECWWYGAATSSVRAAVKSSDAGARMVACLRTQLLASAPVRDLPIVRLAVEAGAEVEVELVATVGVAARC